MKCNLELVRRSLHSWSTVLISEQGGLWFFYVFQNQKPAWLRGFSELLSVCQEVTGYSVHLKIRPSKWCHQEKEPLYWDWFCGLVWCTRFLKITPTRMSFMHGCYTQVSLILLLHRVPAHHLVCLSHGKSQQKGQSIHLIWLTTGQHFCPS